MKALEKAAKLRSVREQLELAASSLDEVGMGFTAERLRKEIRTVLLEELNVRGWAVEEGRPYYGG